MRVFHGIFYDGIGNFEFEGALGSWNFSQGMGIHHKNWNLSLLPKPTGRQADARRFTGTEHVVNDIHLM